MFDAIEENRDGDESIEGKDGKIYRKNDPAFVWKKQEKGVKIRELETGWKIKKIDKVRGFITLEKGSEVKTMPLDNFEVTQQAGVSYK
jgi:hypothetical protein